VPSLHPDNESLAPAGQGAALREVTSSLGQAGVAHVVFGSIALRALGRPRHPAGEPEDIDLLIRPTDAGAALDALTGADFDIEESDPSRHNRLSRGNIEVDLVFRTAGDLHLDEEMAARAVPADADGVSVPLIPPEDYAVMKAMLYEEHRPYEWFDALALVTRPDLDWAYLVRRAQQHGAQRVLSLLLYARSSGVTVPQTAIDDLTNAVDG
jgi:predicted nucleotidyltransferase